MIFVHTSIPFDIAHFDDAITLVRDLVDQSRREVGTVRYRATIDVHDEYTVRFFEQYEDEAALTQHTRTDHYQQFNSRLPELVDGQIETITVTADDSVKVHRFTADEIPME